MSKYKIAIVTRTMNCGGAENIHLMLGEWLQQHGHEVTIITTADRGNWFGRVEKYGIQAIHISGKHTFHPLFHAFKAAKVVLKGSYDFVLLSNSERFVQAAINIIPDSVAIIPWIHSDEEDHYRKAGVNKNSWNIAVAVSPKIAAVAQHRFGKPVVFIPNGIKPNNELINVNRADISKHLRLLFVGRIENRSKGIFLLPDIIDKIQKLGVDYTFHIIGDGFDKNELKRRFCNSIAFENVVFLGELPSDQVFYEYMSAHIVLVPSYFEGLPTVPIEAQWCGCVPIASKIEGVTDAVIQNGKTGFLVTKEDTNAFAKATIRFVRNQQLWKEFSQSGHNFVKNQFTQEKMGKRFEKLFINIKSGKYPAVNRTSWLPVNPSAFTWREHIPRSVHRLGIGVKLRKMIRFNRQD